MCNAELKQTLDYIMYTGCMIIMYHTVYNSWLFFFFFWSITGNLSMTPVNRCSLGCNDIL